MNLFQAHAQGTPLVIGTKLGGERLIAEVFPIRGGVVYADIGWPGASFHPFHVVKGAHRETAEGWAVGKALVRAAFEGEKAHEDWLRWVACRDRNGWTRKLCAAEIVRSGILSDADASQLLRKTGCGSRKGI